MFGHYICCAQGEKGINGQPPEYSSGKIKSDTGGVWDMIHCKTEDTIVFPHIDSCMGVILRLQGALEIIGIHLGFEGTFGFGYKPAVEYYIEKTRQIKQNVKCGVFFDPTGAWKEEVKKQEWCTNLNMANNKYLGPDDIHSCDVWVHDDTIWHRPWNSNLNSKVYPYDPIPVNQCTRISILNIKGKDV